MQKILSDYDIEIIEKKEADEKNRDDLSVAEFMSQKKRLEKMEEDDIISWSKRHRR